MIGRVCEVEQMVGNGRIEKLNETAQLPASGQPGPASTWPADQLPFDSGAPFSLVEHSRHSQSKPFRGPASAKSRSARRNWNSDCFGKGE